MRGREEARESAASSSHASSAAATRTVNTPRSSGAPSGTACFPGRFASGHAPAGKRPEERRRSSVHAPHLGIWDAGTSAPPRKSLERPQSRSNTENARPPRASSSAEAFGRGTRKRHSAASKVGLRVCVSAGVRYLRDLRAPNAPTSTNGSEYDVQSAPRRPSHETMTTWACVMGGSEGGRSEAPAGSADEEEDEEGPAEVGSSRAEISPLAPPPRAPGPAASVSRERFQDGTDWNRPVGVPPGVRGVVGGGAEEEGRRRFAPAGPPRGRPSRSQAGPTSPGTSRRSPRPRPRPRARVSRTPRPSRAPRERARPRRRGGGRARVAWDSTTRRAAVS